MTIQWKLRRYLWCDYSISCLERYFLKIKAVKLTMYVVTNHLNWSPMKCSNNATKTELDTLRKYVYLCYKTQNNLQINSDASRSQMVSDIKMCHKVKISQNKQNWLNWLHHNEKIFSCSKPLGYCPKVREL